MRGTVKGVLMGLDEILVQFDDRFVCEAGDIVEVDIPKEKRSNNANALYWELNGKLAKKMGTSGLALYKHHIREIACWDTLVMDTEAVDGFRARWTSGHLGRFIETREGHDPRRTVVLAYYGSSDFDKRQMSRLISNCLQDCHANSIATISQEDADRLLAGWRG